MNGMCITNVGKVPNATRNRCGTGTFCDTVFASTDLGFNMPRKHLPYVNSYRDRTGKMRYYLRRPGCKQIALSGEPGTREFMQSYAAVIATPPKVKKVWPKVRRGQIYYLSDGEYVKIGFTTNWNERQKKYRTHSGREILLLAMHPGFKSNETKLHQRFGRYRLRGDWFLPATEIMDHIKETIGELNAA
jgi:hypothetical protein